MNENDQQFFYHDNNMGVSNFLFFYSKKLLYFQKRKIKILLELFKILFFELKDLYLYLIIY